MNAGAGPHIDNRVGGHDRIGIMLDDNHRIALIAQRLECIDQFMMIDRMKADRGLIEDVDGSDESCTDLRCKPNPLRLAAAESG